MLFYTKALLGSDYSDIRDYVARTLEDKQKVSSLPHDFVSLNVNKLKDTKWMRDFSQRHPELVLRYAMGFWCAPRSRGLIHKDLDAWAVNLPVSEPGGRQVWVSVTEKPNLTTYGNTSPTPFELYPDHVSRIELQELILDVPHFVKVDQLHYIDNTQNSQTRAIVTLRFSGLTEDYVRALN